MHLRPTKLGLLISVNACWLMSCMMCELPMYVLYVNVFLFVSLVVLVPTVAWTVLLSQTANSSSRLKATELTYQSDRRT